MHGAFRHGGYDPERGRFRPWLFTVVRNKLRDFLAARTRRRGDSAGLADLPAPGGDPAAEFEQECERRLFAWAAEQVRGRFQPATWQAFWRTAVENQNPREVCRDLGLSVGAVYIAKSRVLARLVTVAMWQRDGSMRISATLRRSGTVPVPPRLWR